MIEHFKALPDPRVDRTKDHDLIGRLVIAIGTLPGASTRAGRGPDTRWKMWRRSVGWP